MKPLKTVCQIIAALLILCGLLSAPLYAAEDALELKIETLAEQRVDIQAVVMALVYNLQGAKEQGIGPVMFDEDFGRLSDGTGLSYREFKLLGAAITKDISLLDDEKYRELSVVLEFVDPGLRSAFVDVTANYYLSRELIFLEKATATPLYVDRGQVGLFFLPAKELPPLSAMSALGYPAVAELIATYALDKEALQAIEPGKMNRLRVIATNPSRLPTETRLGLSIVGDDNESMAIASAAKSWNLNGWPIAAADGIFILNTEPNFLFEVSQTEAKSKTKVVVNRFPSNFGHE